MDWYSVVKFLHIISATLWVGGGFTLMLLALLAERAGNIQGTLQAMRATGELGNTFFAPMSMATLVFGLIMCWFWVGFSDLWIVIGLAGYAMTFCVGMFVFKPTADRMAKMIARDGITPAALGHGQRILNAARFDYSVMLVIVVDMVLKPTAHDIATLVCMALIIVAGATLALGRPRRLRPSAA
ncbi:DUF2269 family protein [Mesorhizobium sp. INR15]|uniref:DUF2269 family protein n=1 Tax=Mesorhizobium sp. INR15 TaxID=2654248 RepID=UPI00189663FE|nr:DUF2269 family protein [Mesorhizobium sp. INR15]QPC90392.1 DUF2269 family protein [Mesorhizobium sp. INR15]